MSVSHRGASRQIEIALFLVSFLSFAYFYQASDHSTACRFDLIRSLLEKHTVAIEAFSGWNTADIFSFNGHVYSAKAPGGAFTGLLPWGISSLVVSALQPRTDAMFWALTTWFTIVLSSSLIVALGVVLIYRFALWFGASAGRAVALALTMAFATIMFVYATEMTGEPIAGICALAALYLLATRQAECDPLTACFAGFLAGWAVLNDYPAFIIAAALGVYAIFKLKSLKLVASFSLGALVCAGLLVAYNYAQFSNPFFLSYQAYKLAGNTNQFPEQARGFVGLTFPKLYNFWKITFDPQRGLYFCNPVLLLSFPGLVYFWRRPRFRAEFWVVAIAIVGFILFNASYGESIVSWGGGTATGPRQAAPAIPFMVLALVFLPRGYNYLYGGLAMLSAFIMLMAVSVEPHFPYEYQNPVRDFAFPAFFRADFGYNKLNYYGGPPVAGDSTAFNIGKLAGIPRAFQLWPLMALWMVAAFELVRILNVFEARPSRRIAGPLVTAVAVMLFFLPPTAGALLPLTQNRPQGLLGHYYSGMEADGYPPHLERIDRELDFNNLSEMGALPYPSHAVWTGKIIISRPGLYRFNINVDDTGWIKIDDRAVIADPGNVMRPFDSGQIELSGGAHRIEIGERNIVGDSGLHVFWQPPGENQQLLPPEVLIPDSPDGR